MNATSSIGIVVYRNSVYAYVCIIHVRISMRMPSSLPCARVSIKGPLLCTCIHNYTY